VGSGRKPTSGEGRLDTVGESEGAAEIDGALETDGTLETDGYNVTMAINVSILKAMLTNSLVLKLTEEVGCIVG
jgi:hypothetical protein